MISIETESLHGGMHVPNRFRVVADDIGMQAEDGRLRKDVTKTFRLRSVSLLPFYQ